MIFLKNQDRQDGFTLVELMVVVAIIGLLSAVAIPNFKKYQAKAKISEAKLQLSAAYTAEQSFYSDFNIYHHCLNYMGFNPSNEISQRYFAIGFIDSTTISGASESRAVISGLNTTATLGCTKVAVNATTGSFFPGGKITSNGFAATYGNSATNAAFAASTLGTQDTVTAETFVIAAAGPVDASKSTTALMAGLTITERKTIMQNIVGY
jgi:type IV pilus assembly protein PilA